MITKFEQLSNELILICFSYFNFYELYETFSNLNQRFNHLIQYESKLYINLDLVPNTKFLTFCLNLNQFIATSQNYPLSVIAHDKYKLNVIFYDDLFKDKFSKLKSLTLSNITIETIYSIIFETAAKLYESLRRLSLLDEISTEDKREEDNNIQKLCNNLISSKMKSLIYLHLNFEPYRCGCQNDRSSHTYDICLDFKELSRTENSLSHLETLIIGEICDDDNYTISAPTLCFYSLITDLLLCLPKLKKLIINSIHFIGYYDRRQYTTSSTTTTNLILPLNLKMIKIWIDNVDGDDEEEDKNLTRNFVINNNLSKTAIIKIFNIEYEKDF
ncbi:unnamed protein product [Rotaria sp. Silwood2]|nr:unnamed protein product [Rotaria sp. Silwood2]